MPVGIESVIEGRPIPGEHGPAADSADRLGEVSVVTIRHFVGVGRRIATGRMDVWRVEIEERVFRVVAPNHLKRGRVLDLDALKALD